MKKTILSAVFAAVALIAHGAAFISVQGQYIDGSGSTNQIVAGTNVTVSTVNALTTNYYNLPSVTYNTNNWPGISFPTPFNVIPFRYIGVYSSWTNLTTNALTFKFACSPDNSLWVSNAFVFAPTSGAPYATNIDTQGFPFWALQEIDNIGATNVTGLTLRVAPKATSP